MATDPFGYKFSALRFSNDMLFVILRTSGEIAFPTIPLDIREWAIGYCCPSPPIVALPKEPFCFHFRLPCALCVSNYPIWQRLHSPPPCVMPWHSGHSVVCPSSSLSYGILFSLCALCFSYAFIISPKWGYCQGGQCKFIVNEFLGGGIGGDFLGLVGVSGGLWGESGDFGFCVFGLNPGPSSVEERAYRR